MNISPAIIDAVARREERELIRRQRAYRGDAAPPAIEGHTIILIDDGLATGSTMRAAAAAVRQQSPARVVVAAPVAADVTCKELDGNVDEIICLSTPEPFIAVGMWYEDFSQTTDEEVRALLQASQRLHSVS